MKRIVVALLMGAVFSGGCGDPELSKRVADLETRMVELEKRGVGVGAPGAAPAASPEEEQAAAGIYQEADQLASKLDIEGAKAKLTALRTEHANTRAAKAGVRLEEELSVIGRPEAPVAVEKWVVGTEADLRGSKATLYVFWEVWCPHCRREVPKLTDMYKKYKPQGLAMVGLTKMSRDTTDQALADFLTENKVEYPIAKEQGEVMSQAYGVRGVPAAAVVKDGKVVWRGHPAKLSDEMIQNWL